MNLTSKRMLQFMTVCAGACALSAAATTTTTWVGDSFEEGTNNMPILQYKQTEISGPAYTNYLWSSSAADDASKLVSGDSAYPGDRPLDTDKLFYLDLATEGTTLSRLITNTCSFTSVPVYVDALIKFTPSEDTPTIEAGTKVAVYVDVNSNLVVHHKTPVGENSVTTNSVFTSLDKISPANWYRLTIEVSVAEGWGGACKIWLNGNVLSHPNACTNAATPLPQLFMLASDANQNLSAVAFQGTGAVDELAVGDDSDVGAELSVIMLTLSYNQSLGSIYTNGTVFVGNGVAIPRNIPIVIDAIDWYQVATITGVTYLEYGGDVSGSNLLNTVTITPTAGANTNLGVTFEQYTGTAPGGIGFTGNIAPLAAWAVTYGKTEAQVTENAASWQDDYLLNVAPDMNAQLMISSIAYDGVKATATVVASTNAVNFNVLNGAMGALTSDNLTNSFAVPGTFTVTTNSATQMTIEVPLNNGKFIKANVQ